MKKSKNYILYILLVLASVFGVFPLFSIESSAKGFDHQALQNNNQVILSDSSNEDEEYIYFVPTKVHFLNNEIVTASYYLHSELHIVNINYSAEGFEVISAIVDENNRNRASFELSVPIGYERSSMSIEVTSSSGKNMTSTLYAITNEHGIFVNPFSFDSAIQEYFKYALDSGLMTQEEYEYIWAELSRDNCVVKDTDLVAHTLEMSMIDLETNIMNSDTEEQASIFGLLEWEDDYGAVHRLRNIMVEIYDKEPSGYNLLGTTYTDNYGCFLYSFDNPDDFWDFENGGYDIFFRAYAGDSNAMVMNVSGNRYYYESEVSENVSDGDTILFARAFQQNTDLGRAFQISQAVLTARDYAREMMGSTPSNVTIRYPYYEVTNGIENKLCFYNRDDRLITITGYSPETGYPTSYASWDVIMHEYGHHIQYELNIINSSSGDIVFKGHIIENNQVDDYSSQDYGTRLAWAESWPTVFGILAQHYYSSYLSNIYTACDTWYTAYNAVDYDLECVDTTLGEGCEQSIIAVLWDLYDSNNDARDNITLGHEDYWAVTTGNQSKRFSDFIGYFYSMYPEYIDGVAPNLSYYKMASSKPYILISGTLSYDNPPAFTWDPQGGSNQFPNDRFILVFYDANGTEIMRDLAEESGFYSLTSDKWRLILSSYGKTYTVVIISVNTHEFVGTGPYYSERSNAFVKPLFDSTTDDIEITDTINYWEIYKEFYMELREYEAVEYKFTFTTEGTRVLQTLTDQDTIIFLYSANRILLASDDDSGYDENALLSYNFEANTEYYVKVKFYDRYNRDYVKLAVTSALLYSSYEEIAEFDEQLTSYTSNLADLQAILIRYTSDYQQNVTIESHALFMTEIYIVRANLQVDCMEKTDSYAFYEDENGIEMCKSSITFTAQPNVPYLIIIRAEDLADFGEVTVFIDN